MNNEKGDDPKCLIFKLYGPEYPIPELRPKIPLYCGISSVVSRVTTFHL